MRRLLAIVLVSLALVSSAFASNVGDGGGTGVMNGITCNSAHNTWTTYWNGHYYVCAWTVSSNFTGWSWNYVG
jgi:hypothetical protein